MALGTKLRVKLLSKATAAAMSSNGGAQGAKSGGSSGGPGSANCDVLVATPLRLVHLLATGGIDLGRVQVVCFDEADKLFEMGQFAEQVDEIPAGCTASRVQRGVSYGAVHSSCCSAQALAVL